MFSTSTDTQWERFGRVDPYFGVYTDAQYRSKHLSSQSRAQFFDTGEQHVERVIAEITRYVNPNFSPARTLDFGCGVGRVAIPLARRFKYVVGLDVSRGMLDEAARSSGGQGITNLDLVYYRGELPEIQGQFDFIHSYVVFQHIRPRRGINIFRRLLAALAPGGVGAIQFVFRVNASPGRRLAMAARRLPLVAPAASFVLHKHWRYPYMEMHCYDMNQVLAAIAASDSRMVHAVFEDFGEYLAAMLLFGKRARSTFRRRNSRA